MKTHLPLLGACCIAFALDVPVPAAKDTPLDAKYLRTHAETRGFMLGRPVKAKPTPDGKAVLFLRSEARVPKLRLYEFDVASGKTRELLTPEQVLKGAEEKLSPEEKARRERQRVSVGGFTDYQLNDDGSLVLLSLSGRLYVLQRASGAVRELKTGDGTILDPKFSPDGKSIAYVKDYDVHVYDLAADRERRVTTGGTEKKTLGLAEFVAQEEMGRHSGYWWSPDSKHIAYEEADADGVEVWYVADPNKPGQPPQPSFYPRPGKKNVAVRVGVVPIAGGETVWLEWDRKEYEYLALVRWDKGGPLTLGVQNRRQDRLLCLAAEAATGKVEQLFEIRAVEGHWINLDEIAVRWTDDGKLVALWGESITRASFSGEVWGRIRQVRTLRYFQRLIHVDAANDSILLEGSWNPTESHIYATRFPVPQGYRIVQENERLTIPRGLHAATGNSKLLCITRTTLDTMPQTIVARPDGRAIEAIGQLPSVAETPGFVPRVEFLHQVPAPRFDLFATPTVLDKDKFYSAIVRPRNFDPKKKYPVIVYVYGGPTHNVVQQSMRSWLLQQWLADQGFIVAAIDNRGTPGRGRDWEKAVYKNFGTVPLEDQVAGLKALGQRFPEMDLNRVGIYGWSFGGYMAALAVLKQPDVFKAAVAGAPVTDWEDYDTHYTERYLGLPQDNPEAYKAASLLTYAKDLRRPLLLIHGTADDNVFFRHSLRLGDSLFRAGRDFEILPLPSLTHMVPDPVVMERLYMRIAGHFRKHLG